MATVRVHSKDARALAQGHPWLYRQAIVERPRNLRAGEIVDVGSAETDFVARGLYDPGSSVAVRVWTRERGERIDGALVARRFRDAVATRERLGLPLRADAYRLVHSEGDRLPGILVDRWGDHLSVTLQGDAVRRHERTILDGILAAASAAAPAASDAAPPRTPRARRARADAQDAGSAEEDAGRPRGPASWPVGIHLRDDSEYRLVAGDPPPDELVVREPSGRFLVRIGAPGKPGLFTDMREVRVALAPRTAGRRFLNLFAHTGAFSAAAAAAGAAEVVSVDLSRVWLDVARRNVELNLPAGRAGDFRHEALTADVFDALRGLASDGRRFDVVLADPPTFSSSKSTGAFNVRDDYRSLARASLRVLAPGGLFVAATNYRAMETDAFLRLLHDAAEMERASLRVLEVMGQPCDHPSLPMVPETRHLHVVFLAVTPAAADE